MPPLHAKSQMSRRQMLIGALGSTGVALLFPAAAKATTEFQLRARFTLLIALVLGPDAEGEVEVNSQAGRKTKSTINVSLQHLGLDAKTKIYVFWYSTIFNEVVPLGSIKVDSKGKASGKFTVKELIIPTDEIYLSTVSNPGPSQIAMRAVLEDTSTI